MRKNPAFLVILILLAVYQTATYYSVLPDVVASHFDGSGNPNGWLSKSAFIGVYWLSLLIMCAIYFFARIQSAQIFCIAVLVVLEVAFEYAFRKNIPALAPIPELWLWATIIGFYIFLIAWLVNHFRTRSKS